MFRLFKQKCPICKMELKENSIEGFGKKFCSEECREEYHKRLAKEQSQRSRSGCCH